MEPVWTTLERGLRTPPSSEGIDVWDTLSDRLNPLRFHPRQIQGCELQRQTTQAGEEYYILTNPAGVYLKLTATQVFIWKLLDGEHSARDIILAYMLQYGALAPQGVMQTLGVLLHNGFLDQPRVDVFKQLSLRFRKSFWGFRLLLVLLSRFMSTSVSIKWADPAYRWIYSKAGYLLFTRPAQLVLFAVLCLGLGAFGYLISTHNYDFFSVNSSWSLGLLTLYVSLTLVAILHESGHALTCIHYGRRVRKGGVMIYIGMIAFYIDTTDIWMAPRRARIAVSWAGPYVNLLCTGVLSLLVLCFPDWSLSDVFIKVAGTSAFLAVMNLNPLLLLDGYFILIDALEIPNLRNKAFEFLKVNLSHPSRRWLRLSRREKVLASYGAFAALYTGLMIFIGLRALTRMVYEGLVGLVGTPWANNILVASAGVIGTSLALTMVRRQLKLHA